jgi:zona occludens toxin (predicted ATPase)
MIQIVQGFGLGAGKSYYLLTRILQHLNCGGTVVITDQFGLFVEKVVEYFRDTLGLHLPASQVRVATAAESWRMHELTPMGTAECPVLIILDEAHSQLNARDWADKNKRAFFDWLTQSRHDDCDVIFCTQNYHNLDKQVARLATNIIDVRNMAFFKILLIGTYRKNYFRVSVYDQDGRSKLEHFWLKKESAKFALYDSKVMRGRHKRTGEIVTKLKLLKAKKKGVRCSSF